MMERIRKIRLTPELSILLTYLFTTTVIVVRTWWTIRSGWFVGDEAFYISSILMSVQYKAFVYLSLRHVIFMWANAIFGWLLNLDSVFRMIPFLTIQAFFWNGICTWALYKTVKKMGLKEDSQTVVFLTTSMVAIYVLMNGLYLTEAPSMAFTLLSVYFFLSSVETHSLKDFFLTGLTITIAYLYREPYLMFIALDALLILFLVFKRRLKPVHLILFLLVPILLVNLPVAVFQHSIFEVYTGFREFCLGSYHNLVDPIVEGSWYPPVIYGPPEDVKDLLTVYVTDTLDMWSANLALTGDLVVRAKRSLLITGRGLFYGWSIVLVLPVLLGLIESFRRWKTDDRSKVIAITVLAAFMSLVFMGWFLSPSKYLSTSSAIAIAMRFAYTTFPMVLGIGVLYERVDRNPINSLVLVGVVALLLSPQILTRFQSNQSEEVMNRVYLSYKAPPYRTYECVKDRPGTVLVIVEPAFRAFLYLSTLEHVTVARMRMNETVFLNLTVTHDATFFYQEKWPRYGMVHDLFPFMKEVVRNNTQYQMAVIWETPEAYLYELIRPEPVINEKVILFLSDGRLWRAERVGEKYVFSSEDEQLVFGDVATLYSDGQLKQYIAFDWIRVNDELITTTNQTRFQIDSYLAVNK